MRQEERISQLERDLARLEGIVETLTRNMESEHAAARESRQEDRRSIRELGEKMEKSVAALASEIKALAEKNAGEIKTLAEKGALQSTQAIASQSQAAGALSFGNWILRAVIGIAGLWVAFQAGKDTAPPAPYHIERPAEIPGEVR